MTALEWGLPVVAKYLFGGLSLGAFVTYYLWQGFGLKTFRPLAKLAWISAAVWGLLIPIPIFSHLGQPGRWYTLLFDFHWTSPMSWAGPILLAYLVVVLLNGRFFFYPDVVLAYRNAKGLRKKALRILLITRPPQGPIPKASQVGLKVTGALAFVLVLSFGYTGLELGILSSRPLWANPINPVMFLLTGLISGMAFVVLLWIALDGRVEAPRAPGEKTILTSFALPALLAFFLGLNAVFYVSLAYSVPEVVQAVGVLATGELAPMFLWVGLGLGALVPAVFLAANAVLRSPRRWMATLASGLILIGAFAQKYGFVVGGQVLAEVGGEVPSSLWPTSSGIIEFLSILALAYFLFQVALWISPWRAPKPAEREAAPAPEVTA
ncbi:MAG TPA: NrfD/PsrC family molybdoenzyme membrane anchor subunit [Thermoplasmata archaeon]